MLKHIAIGPCQGGAYFAAYQTPGCKVMTTACACATRDQAQAEADRLNRMQLAAERSVMLERRARGLAGTYPALKGKH